MRGVSDLSIARAWVPPNRFRPMRLAFNIAEPLILVPRNVHALDDEGLLAAHSLHARLRSVRGESVLARRTLPGSEPLGVLLCDLMRIRFDGLRVASQLPPHHTSDVRKRVVSGSVGAFSSSATTSSR